MPRFVPALCLFILFTGCDQSVTLTGFSKEDWRTDPQGCLGKRKNLSLIILDRKKELYGLKEPDIINLFGDPDQRELHERNQKFFIYNVIAEQCQTSSPSQRLSIRFNSLGKCSEVLILKDHDQPSS